MNTPTHLVINWSLARGSGVDYPLSAVLLGSVAPDLPLYGLSIGGGLYYRFVRGMSVSETAHKLWDELYFHDPWWISLHNVLHSPLVLVTVLAGLWLWLGSSGFLGSWFSWFFLSCLAHTLVDIPVHHNDGPLLLWPLDWRTRFNSPVSYWHPAHYGVPCMIFEACLFLWLAARLALPVIRQWFGVEAGEA